MGHKATSEATSNRRNSPAIDHALCAHNGGGAWRNEKSDEVCHLFRLGWSTERNPAESFHDDQLSALLVGAGLCGQAFCQCDSCFGLDPTGRDAHHPDTLGRHLFRETLAIGR